MDSLALIFCLCLHYLKTFYLQSMICPYKNDKRKTETNKKANKPQYHQVILKFKKRNGIFKKERKPLDSGYHDNNHCSKIMGA